MVIKVILVILFKLLLDISYIFYLDIEYNYQGFILSLNEVKVFEGYLSIIILYVIVFYKRSFSRFSSIILSLLFIIVIVPFSILFALENQNRSFYYFILLGFLFSSFIAYLPVIKMKKININSGYLINSLMTLSFFIILVMIYYNGLPSFAALNFNNVYEIREENSYPSIMNYFFLWQSKVFGPFLIAYFLYNNQKTRFMIILFIQFALYLITAHKIVLFGPILVIGLYIILKIFKKIELLILCGANSLVLVSFLLYYFNVTEWAASLFVRRMFFVPAKNGFYSYDYFSEAGNIYLSNSFLRGISEYPYSISLYNIIGKEFYGSPTVNANAGYLADAFIHFNFLGILLFSILLGLLLLLMDCFGKGLPLPIIMGLTVMGFYSIVDSPLFTSMLSNGIIIALLFLLLFNQEEPWVKN